MPGAVVVPPTAMLALSLVLVLVLGAAVVLSSPASVSALIRPEPKSKALVRQRLIALERRFARAVPLIVFVQSLRANDDEDDDDEQDVEDDDDDDGDLLTVALEAFGRRNDRASLVLRLDPTARGAGTALARVAATGAVRVLVVVLLPGLASPLLPPIVRTFPLAPKLLLLPSGHGPDARELTLARAVLGDLWRRERAVGTLAVWYRAGRERVAPPHAHFDPFTRTRTAANGTGAKEDDTSTDELLTGGTFRFGTHFPSLESPGPPAHPTLNLQRVPLTIYGFEAAMAYARKDLDRLPRTFPTAAATHDYLDGLFGADIEALRELGRRLNFTPRVHHTPDNFGFRAANGSYTGTLGHLVTRRDAWLSLNVYFLKDYETRDVQFTAAVYQDSLCVFVKAAGMLPDWLLIFRCFSPTLWIVLWSTVALVSVCYVALAQCIAAVRPGEGAGCPPFAATGQHRAAPQGPVELVGQIVGALLNAPTDGIGRTTSPHRRLLIAFAFIWGMTVMGAFQGSLVDVYTTPTSMRNLDTLAELEASGLTITVNAPALIVDVFGTERPGTTLGNLRRRLLIDANPARPAGPAVLTGRTAGLIRNQDFGRLSTKYLGRDGTTRLHRLRQCPRSYPLAYLYPRGSPLYRAANWHLLHFLQHGLFAKWERDATRTLALNRALKVHHYQRTTQQGAGTGPGVGGLVQLHLGHLLLPFMLLAGGLGLAAASFACECLRGRAATRRSAGEGKRRAGEGGVGREGNASKATGNALVKRT